MAEAPIEIPRQEPYDFTEWDTPTIKAVAKIMWDELQAKQLPEADLRSLDRELGHLTFEMWCRKQEAEA